MADIQAASGMIQWGVNGATVILMIVAASLAIRKKNNLCLGVAILGNLAAYYFLKSPLVCMVISIACAIWALVGKSKGKEQTASNVNVRGSSVNAKDESNDKGEKKVKCRFCKKLYSSEYNGCPYCKKV